MDNNWISVATGESALMISCSEENQAKYRTGHVLLTQNSTNKTKTIEVSQLGVDSRPIFDRTIIIQFDGDVSVTTGSVNMIFGNDIEIITGDCTIDGRTLIVPVRGIEKTIKIRSYSVPLVTKIYWSLTAQENVPVDLWLNGYSATLHESLQFEEGHYADVSAFSLPTEPTYLKFVLNKVNNYEIKFDITFPNYLTSYYCEMTVFFGDKLADVSLDGEQQNVSHFQFLPSLPKQFQLRYTKEGETNENIASFKLTLPTWPIALDSATIKFYDAKKISNVDLSDFTSIKFDISSMDTWKTLNTTLEPYHTPSEPHPGGEGEDDQEEDNYYGYKFTYDGGIRVMHWLKDNSYINMFIEDPNDTLHAPLLNGFYDTTDGSIVLNGSYTLNEIVEVVSALSVTGVNNYNKLYDLLKGRDIQTAQHAYESYQAHAQIPETVETGYTANP